MIDLFDPSTPIVPTGKWFDEEIMPLVGDSWRFVDALMTAPDQAHIVGELWEKGVLVQVDRAADPAKIWHEMRRRFRAGFAVKKLDGNTLLVRFNHMNLVTLTWSNGMVLNPDLQAYGEP